MHRFEERYDGWNSSHRETERPLGNLFSDLTHEIGTLVRDELRLASLEVGDKASRAARDLGMLILGGAVLYGGFLAAIFTLILLLDLGLHALWASALIVTIVVLALGYFLARGALDNLKKQDLTPRQTLRSIQADFDAVGGTRR